MKMAKIVSIFFLVQGGLCDTGLPTAIVDGEKGKIAGGQPAVQGDIPYQIALQYTRNLDTTFVCGGTLISSTEVLTAAQCCIELDSKDVGVVAGSVSDELQKFQLRGMASYKIHKDFNTDPSRTDFSNDICIITVSNPFNLTDPKVSALPPGRTENCKIGSQCRVSGYGGEAQSSKLDHLMYADIPILADDKCSNYSKLLLKYNSDLMICAGKVEGGIGFCGKDTGGPLICNSHLCGVISFSQGCAQSGYPGVYTKVDRYIDWINEPTGSATSNRNSFFIVMAMGIVAKFYF